MKLACPNINLYKHLQYIAGDTNCAEESIFPSTLNHQTFIAVYCSSIIAMNDLYLKSYEFLVYI